MKKQLIPNVNSQNLLAVSVLLVSLSAVIVSIFQANIMKEQQEIMHKDFEASLWPNIEITYNYNPKEHFEIMVTNNGVGPAIIEGISIKRGDVYLNGWDDVQQLIQVDSAGSYLTSNSGIINTVISAGEERKFFAVYNEKIAQALYKLYDELEFSVCYKSVYDTYWVHRRFFDNNRSTATVNQASECTIDEFTLFDDVLQLK